MCQEAVWVQEQNWEKIPDMPVWVVVEPPEFLSAYVTGAVWCEHTKKWHWWDECSKTGRALTGTVSYVMWRQLKPKLP